MKYKVFDNLVHSDLADRTEEVMTNDSFPWFCMIKTVYKEIKEDPYNDGIKYKDRCTFGHQFTLGDQAKSNSNYYSIPIDILTVVSEKLGWGNPEIIRIRANYLYPVDETQRILPMCPHVDGYYRHAVLLYYVDDSDGETILFDNEMKPSVVVEPRKGRCLLFDGSIMHAGVPPSRHDKRIVINYNLRMEL